jgi:hypothetical protein
MIEMPGLQPSYSQITRVSSFGHFDPVACSQPPLNFADTAAAVFVLLQVAVL